MSIHQMNAVWKRSKQKGSKRLLLLAIADNANEDGTAWPGLDHLAGKTLLSRRHVSRLISELDGTDELAVVWGGGRGTANLYHVLCDKTAQEIADIKHEVAQQNALNHDKLSPFNGGDDNLSPPTINHDIFTKKYDKLSKKDDKLSGGHDIFGVKHDIAMSSEPYNHQEPKKRTSDLNGARGKSVDGLSEKQQGEKAQRLVRVWETVLADLRHAVPPGAFGWFENSRLMGLQDIGDGDVAAEIAVKNDHAADWINNRLQTVVRRHVSAAAGCDCAVVSARALRLREVA